MESLSSGSSKKARRPGSGTQVPSCLVDGCSSDLNKCRDYHRKHKVCEFHSKTSKVFVKGQERRFCQQCSRFQSLGEFDEGKRSCRRRLEGHNRRRRKPQPDSLSSPLISSHQGTRYIHFGDPQAISASTTTASSAGVVNVEEHSAIYNCQTSLNFNGRKNPYPGSLCDKGGKQFAFLQGTNSMFPTEPVGQATLNDTTAILVDSGSQKIFSDGLNRVIDSNRALSLLSSPPAETWEANSHHMVQPQLTVPAQSLISNLNYNTIEVVGMPAGSLLFSDRSNACLHRHNMFHILPDESSTSGAQQKMSFSWE